MAGIYIHIPFCKQACHYCDFHFSTSLHKKEAMLSALEKELILRKEEMDNIAVETIYFGGGTPSILETDEINRLIAVVAANYQLTHAPEITLEANPDDLVPEKITALASSQLNRLSIGIQSFYDEDLRFMNRAHSATEARACIVNAQDAGFENLSIDLMYGIPQMSNKRWVENITKALSYNIPHISAYALTVEPKTALEKFIKKGIVDAPDDESAQEHFLILSNLMEKNGYINYELSNFGKPSFFSKNNTAYWQGKKYIGIGPSAHSYNGKQRSWNVANNNIYIKALQQNERSFTVEDLSVKDRYNEYVMTGLRTIWGVSTAKIAHNFGEQYKTYFLVQARRYLETDLLESTNLINSVGVEEHIVKTTLKGRFLSDGIASDLFILK